jgi:NADH dehydrogenase/NADH:ubiquinone oxidoreductase subunit G
MSALKKMNKATISAVNKQLLSDFKREKKESLGDMKEYLKNTNLSEEEKLKRYSEFSANLSGTMITQCLQASTSIVVNDAQIYEQSLINTAQINAFNKQGEESTQNKLLKIQETLLAKEKIGIAKVEKQQITAKTVLAVMETAAKVNLTNAQIVTEARKNGAELTSSLKTYTDPETGATISYSHISLAAATATDTEKGLIGYQMNQLKQQANSFENHTKVQIGSQLTNQIATAIDSDMTEITGLMNSYKTLAESISGIDFDTNYSTIETS